MWPLTGLVRVSAEVYLKYLIVLLLSITVNVNAAEIAAPASLESVYQQDMFHYYRGDEIKMMLAGETEFAALFRDRTSAMAKGVAILLPDWHMPANNHYGLDFLRTELNEYGWISYAMNIPDPIAFYNNDIQADPTVFHAPALAILNKDDLAAYKLQLLSRFKALYQSALNHPGFIVVIAQGASSSLLVEYFSEEAEEEVDAFVFLSSYLPDPELNYTLNQRFAKVSAPVLDIFTSEDSNLVKTTLQQRKKMATKEHKINYRQRELFSSQQNPRQQARLLKEIYGFLTKIGI